MNFSTVHQTVGNKFHSTQIIPQTNMVYRPFFGVENNSHTRYMPWISKLFARPAENCEQEQPLLELSGNRHFRQSCSSRKRRRKCAKLHYIISLHDPSKQAYEQDSKNNYKCN